MWVVGDRKLKNVCFIYGNRSRPIWLHRNEKSSLFISCWTSSDYAISLNISEFQAVDLRRLCQSQNLQLQVEHASPISAVEHYVALTALITMAGKWIMHMQHINYSSCNSNLLCCRLSKHPQKKEEEEEKLSVNNLEMQDFTSRGPCMSAETQWQKPICQSCRSPTLRTSFTCQLKLFFTPDICVGFPSRP